jgi:D-beta-D-heptose 7-phosphate kinase / D-beta-D-heptose 1-phosphate adenosyltransferase
MNPADLIARFSGCRVLVIGEAMLDRYVEGRVDRLCREAPVPIVALNGQNDVPGGGANTAVAAAVLGAQTRFVSVIGDDAAGTSLSAALSDAGVATDTLFRAPGRDTLVKQRVTANGQLLMRLDSGSEGAVDTMSERRMLDALAAHWDSADAVIISDYGYGICTKAVLDSIAAHQRRAPRVLMADAKDLARWRDVGLTAAKPNYAEAVELAGLTPVTGTLPRVEQIIAARCALVERIDAQVVAVTLDTAGAVILAQGDEPYRTFTTPNVDSHAAGAGDTFTATFATALAAGAPVTVAGDLASAAAMVCVARSGTTVCHAAELHSQLVGRVRSGGDEIGAQIAALRSHDKRIVFTNGCFDILHHGHIAYLNRAKAMGDVLIVGLNSDASVRALKGPSRPINNEDDRAAVLAALSSVDLVLLFDEPTPARLIEAIRPDLFVKGGDYTRDILPEAPLVEALGGEVKILPFLDDRSTTGIIERIRRAYPLEAATG